MGSIYEDFCRSEAQRRGIDPQVAVDAANTEGGLTEPARRGTFDTGSSWWMYQLHFGGRGYEYLGTVAGMGNSFAAFTGWRPGDPRAWRDAARYALDEIKRAGWSKWYGPATIGITGMRGIDTNFHWGGTPDNEWDFKTGAMPPMETLPFLPDAPIDQQPNDWSCALQSTQWLLRSIGRNPDASNPVGDPWLTSELVPGIISPDVGLRNATGQPLADWITRTYGAEMGFLAQASPVTFDDVAAGAGVNPMIIGGRAWNHWAGVRALRSDGALRIANPSSGWKGVDQSMSRAQFDALGPFSCVWIDRASTLTAPPPVPVPPTPPAVDTRVERATTLLRQALAVLEEPVSG